MAVEAGSFWGLRLGEQIAIKEMDKKKTQELINPIKALWQIWQFSQEKGLLSDTRIELVRLMKKITVFGGGQTEIFYEAMELMQADLRKRGEIVTGAQVKNDSGLVNNLWPK